MIKAKVYRNPESRNKEFEGEAVMKKLLNQFELNNSMKQCLVQFDGSEEVVVRTVRAKDMFVVKG